MIKLTVNGQPQQYDGDPEMPLHWVLRDELNLKGTKFGCGMGLCGACTVHVNGEPTRSCVRRALSSGYYALFHLLISDATANCTDAQFRATLARLFDHGSMKQASERKLSELNGFFDQRPPEGPERTIKYHLYIVAETFLLAQHNRNEADYNLLREWQPTQVSLLLEGIADAFKSWTIIRHETAAR